MNKGEIIIYQGPDGGPELQVTLQDDSIWLTQTQMSQLFGRNKRTISEHIRNVFKEGELLELTTVRDFRTVGQNDKTYDLIHYNLDVAISVGYRIKSPQGTQFRQWATQALRDYAIKGYALNNQRLTEQQVRAQVAEEMRLILALPQAGELSAREQKGFVELIERYSKSMVLLNQFDEGRLTAEGSQEPVYVLTTSDCLQMVA